MNFMYNVMTNGIGGVMCGNTTEDDVVYHSENEILVNQKLYTLLMKDKGGSLKLGYLKRVKTNIVTKKGRKIYNYALTNEAIIAKDSLIRVYKKRFEKEDV